MSLRASAVPGIEVHAPTSIERAQRGVCDAGAFGEAGCATPVNALAATAADRAMKSRRAARESEFIVVGMGEPSAAALERGAGSPIDDTGGGQRCKVLAPVHAMAGSTMATWTNDAELQDPSSHSTNSYGRHRNISV